MSKMTALTVSLFQAHKIQKLLLEQEPKPQDRLKTWTIAKDSILRSLRVQIK